MFDIVVLRHALRAYSVLVLRAVRFINNGLLLSALDADGTPASLALMLLSYYDLELCAADLTTFLL